MTEFIIHFISSAQCKSVVTFLAKLRFLQVCEIHTKTHILSYQPKKITGLLFLGSVGRFLSLFFFVFKKKKCRVGPNFRVGRVTPIQQFFFFAL